MNEKPPKPSMLKIALQDSWTVGAGLFGIIVAGVVIFMIIQTPARDRIGGFWAAMGLFAAIAGACFAFIAWHLPQRSRHVYDVWERGILGTAKLLSVKDIGMRRTRQRVIRYQYNYESQVYEKGDNVKLTWHPTDEELDIIIDPQDPDTALLVILFD